MHPDYYDKATPDQLLAEAREAMSEFDPEDGRPITDPEWRLLVAVEELDEKLQAGGSLPAAWQTAAKRT